MPRRGNDEVPAARSRLDHMYVSCLSIDLQMLRHIIETYTVRALTLWAPRVFRNMEEISDQQELMDLLSRLCSTIRLLDGNEPDPIDDWELLK